MGIFKGAPLESVFGYFCQKTKVTQPRQDKVNLVHKTKKQSKPVSIIKKKKLTHIFHMCVSPFVLPILKTNNYINESSQKIL